MSRSEKKRARTGPEVRRAMIIEEAILLVGEHGYSGFVLQELAQRCGLSNGGLLYHFHSKEELLLAVLGEYERRMEARLTVITDELRAQDSTFSLPTIKRLLRSLLMENVAQPELARLDTVLDTEALSPRHPAHNYFREREARFLAQFSGVLASHDADAPSSARQLLSLLQGLLLQWLRADGCFDIASEWDRAVEKILPDLQAGRKA